MKLWTEEEVNYLRLNYNNNSNKEISDYLGKSIKQVSDKKNYLGLITNTILNKRWSEEDINYLKENYNTNSDKFIADVLGKTAESVRNKIYKSGLVEKKTKWVDFEIEYLKIHYHNTPNVELCEFLNKSNEQIYFYAKKLSLYKSKPDVYTRTYGKKKRLTFDYCKEIALNYTTRTELNFNNNSVYCTIVKKGWDVKLFNHFIKTGYSTPQLILSEIIIYLFGDIIMNDRKIIKPLEIDVYVPHLKIGFEYDGKRWHNDEQKDKNKETICLMNNIKLIRIVENSRFYENDIKNQIISNLIIINKYCNTKFTSEIIQNIDVSNAFRLILTNTKIKEIALSYKELYEFRKNESIIYNRLNKMNLLSEYTKHMTRRHIKWSDIDELFLKNNYSVLSINELSNYLNKSNNSIYNKAFTLKIRKVL